MPDDGVSDDHSIAFRLAEGSEAVPGGDLEGRRQRRGRGCRPGPGSRLLLLLHPGSVVSPAPEWRASGKIVSWCTRPVQRNTWSRGGGSVSSHTVYLPGLVSVSPGCFQQRWVVQGPKSKVLHIFVHPWTQQLISPEEEPVIPFKSQAVSSQIPSPQRVKVNEIISD